MTGVALTVQPTVQLEDSAGNIVVLAGVPVTASIATGGGTIGGTVTVNSDAAGLAAFADLSLSGIAGAVTLKFAAPVNGQATTVTSSPISVRIPWTIRASMPAPRFGLAVGVVNGILYAVGGSGGDGGVQGAVLAYDPATNSWTTKAAVPTPRFGLAVGVVNGILYAVGGYDGTHYLATVEAYNPVTNSWTTKASMPTPRLAPSVGVVNGLLYAMGGDDYTDVFGDYSSHGIVEAYDPVTDSWTTKAPMLTPRTDFSLGVVNGILYAVGGLKRGRRVRSGHQLVDNQGIDADGARWILGWGGERNPLSRGRAGQYQPQCPGECRCVRSGQRLVDDPRYSADAPLRARGRRVERDALRRGWVQRHRTGNCRGVCPVR